MGLAGVLTGLMMESGSDSWVGIGAWLFAAACIGCVNGVFIAYVGMPAFVVTLGMLSLARSLAVVFSNNRQIYEFGPDSKALLALGGGSTFGVANPVIILAILVLLFGFMFRWTRFGRHIYAVGGNENAATLTGVPVRPIKRSEEHTSELQSLMRH